MKIASQGTFIMYSQSLFYVKQNLIMIQVYCLLSENTNDFLCKENRFLIQKI